MLPLVMIALRRVEKRYDNQHAIRPLDLEIPTGRTTVLLGPSGCGKSTLLRLLMGLVRPDGGEIVFDGEPLTARSLVEIRRRTGYVIQEGGLFPHLTARENVTLAATRLGWARGRCDERVAELAGLTHLDAGLLDRYPAQLSGGQRQRVGLMRALMLDPDVLLLDEPLGALDPIVRHGLQDELRQIFRDLRKTVVLVTHDLAEAAYLADVIVLMRGGRIVQQGTLAELVRSPADAFVSEFVNAHRVPAELAEANP